MSDLAGLGFWLALGLVCSAIGVAAFWARIRQRQMRHDLVLKLLETGKSLDPDTLDKLLAPPRRAQGSPPPAPQADPRAGFRTGNFMFFLIGFGTLLYVFLRHSGPSYPLLALGIFPIAVAFAGWWLGERMYREGTLPTLKYRRDPREPYLSAGFAFFGIGYTTLLIGLTHAGGVSYPILGMGAALLLMWLNTWRVGNKEYREGKLTGIPLERDRT